MNNETLIKTIQDIWFLKDEITMLVEEYNEFEAAKVEYDSLTNHPYGEFLTSRIQYLSRDVAYAELIIDRLQDERYKTILRMRHMQRETVESIAASIGYSPAYIHNLYKKALQAVVLEHERLQL